MTYSSGLKKVSPPPSLCQTPCLFLNERMKNRVLNKILCSVMKNCNATLVFSIYNKYKEGKTFFKYKHK
jgi:hypothetical protein